MSFDTSVSSQAYRDRQRFSGFSTFLEELAYNFNLYRAGQHAALLVVLSDHLNRDPKHAIIRTDALPVSPWKTIRKIENAGFPVVMALNLFGNDFESQLPEFIPSSARPGYFRHFPQFTIPPEGTPTVIHKPHGRNITVPHLRLADGIGG